MDVLGMWEDGRKDFEEISDRQREKGKDNPPPQCIVRDFDPYMLDFRLQMLLLKTNNTVTQLQYLECVPKLGVVVNAWW